MALNCQLLAILMILSQKYVIIEVIYKIYKYYIIWFYCELFIQLFKDKKSIKYSKFKILTLFIKKMIDFEPKTT